MNLKLADRTISYLHFCFKNLNKWGASSSKHYEKINPFGFCTLSVYFHHIRHKQLPQVDYSPSPLSAQQCLKLAAATWKSFTTGFASNRWLTLQLGTKSYSQSTRFFTREGKSFHTDISVSLWLAADIWFSFGLLTMLTSRCLAKCEHPETYSLLCEDSLRWFSL